MNLPRLVRTAWLSPTLMTWASLSIRIGGLALLLPLILTRLVTTEVLVWQLLSTITMLVNWADFGFSPTFSRVIAFARGGGTLAALRAAMPAGDGPDAVIASRPISIPALLATQRAVYRRLIGGAMVFALVGGTAALFHPIELLPQPRDGWIAWGLTFFASQFVLMNGVKVSVLTGYDRVATARRIDAVIGALQLGTTSIVTLADGGLVAIVACYSIWQIPLYLLNRYSVARLEIMRASRAILVFDPAIFQVIWPAAWRSGMGILLSVGVIQMSGIIYAQFAAPAQAAAYLLALRAITSVSQFSQAPFYSKLPTMARLRGEERRDELLRIAIRGMAMAHWTFVVGALAVTIGVPYLLDAIGSSVRLPNLAMCALLNVAFFVERYGAMHLQLYSLTNHIVWHFITAISGGLMVLFFFLLYPLLGAHAMPAAMFVGYAGFYSWYASRLSIRMLGVHRWSFERRTALSPALVLLSGLAIYWILTLERL